MPVYNGERYVAEAIDSVLAQTYTDFELLIVDDGSTDGSAEIIRACATRDSRVRFLQLDRNGGQGPALNAGLAQATGQFITNMDCDDLSLPQRLEKQVNFLGTHPEIGAVGTCARAFNHDLSQRQFDFIVPRQHALIAFNLFFGASFVGATLLTRSEFMQEVGGYTPYRARCPDLDLSCRLLWHTSIRFANLPDCLYLYRRHSSAIGVARKDAQDFAERRFRQRLLSRLWGEGAPDTVDRFQRLRNQDKLHWRARRAAKRDMRRLIDALIAHSCVEPADEPLLIAEMNRRLEQASPRLWQQFCHWRRNRFPRLGH